MTEKEKKVLDIIREEGKISRISLARKTTWNPATIGTIIHSLLESNKIEETNLEASTGGRRARLLQIKKDTQKRILGISFAPHFFQWSLGNIEGKIFETEKCPLPKIKKENIWEWAKKKIQKKLEENPEIEGISVLISGFVDNERGISLFSPHYQWKDFPIQKELEELSGKTVFIENDVRAMALLEKFFGSCKKNQNFVVLNIGDGVGSSIFIQNQLYYGSHLSSGELGHMIVNPKNLIKCSCGKIGCLETEVSNRSILYKLSSRIMLGQYSILKQKFESGKELGIEDFLRALKEKDVLALQITEEVVAMIVKALDAIIAVLNPEKIVLYGKIFQNKYLYQKIMKEMKAVFILEKEYKIEVSNFFEEAYLYAPFALFRHLS